MLTPRGDVDFESFEPDSVSQEPGSQVCLGGFSSSYCFLLGKKLSFITFSAERSLIKNVLSEVSKCTIGTFCVSFKLYSGPYG